MSHATGQDFDALLSSTPFLPHLLNGYFETQLHPFWGLLASRQSELSEHDNRVGEGVGWFSHVPHVAQQLVKALVPSPPVRLHRLIRPPPQGDSATKLEQLSHGLFLIYQEELSLYTTESMVGENVVGKDVGTHSDMHVALQPRSATLSPVGEVPGRLHRPAEYLATQSQSLFFFPTTCHSESSSQYSSE